MSPFNLNDSGLNLDAVALPFSAADPVTEVLQRSVRNMDAVNYVRVEAWKSLRTPRPKSKSAPDALASQCPTQFSGRRWTKLLFGAQICEKCGRREPSSMDVDYALWRRVCWGGEYVQCLVFHQRINPSAQSSQYDARLRAIPRVIFNGIEDHTRPILAGRWRGRCVPVEAHVACAGGYDSKAIRCFVQKQQALVENGGRSMYTTLIFLELTVRCGDWAWHTRRKCSRDYKTMLDKVAIRLIEAQRCVSSPRDLTSGTCVWNPAHPHIVPHVIDTQAQRLARERETCIVHRKQAIVSAALMELRTPVPAFIEWEGARAHSHCVMWRPAGEQLVEFDPQGSPAAAALAVLLGLDPGTVDKADAVCVWDLSAGVAAPTAGERVARLCTVVFLIRSESPAHYHVSVFHASSSDVDKVASEIIYAPSALLFVILYSFCAPNHQIAEPAEGEHFIRFLGPEIPWQRRVMLFVSGAHTDATAARSSSHEALLT
ncbi:hypothetical protein GGX14DRAFT_633438 [Mycena pura]|uniref:Uncharacterized protein n=1 Tax=Mycena pura TaxID=153505 RepID=A0AAD6YC84_9AGAR|nr:hypothetical protein GGX14DRAFT_633438 [Mycena pura]